MTEMPTTPPPPPYYAPANKGVFGTKVPSSVAFIIGVLLFFLPFVDLKCNNMSVMKFSGVELATGYNLKTPGDNSLLGGFDNLDGGNAQKTKTGKKDFNIYALAALILGVLGFVVSLLAGKAGGIAGVITGVLAVAAMIVLFINIKSSSELEEANKSTGEPSFGQIGDTIITLEFTPWFYTAVIAFIAAVFFSFKRTQANK